MELFVFIFDSNIKEKNDFFYIDEVRKIGKKEENIFIKEIKPAWSNIPKGTLNQIDNEFQTKNVIFISDFMDKKGVRYLQNLLKKNNKWFGLISSQYKMIEKHKEHIELCELENYLGWHERDRNAEDYGFYRIWEAISECKKNNRIRKKYFDINLGVVIKDCKRKLFELKEDLLFQIVPVEFGNIDNNLSERIKNLKRESTSLDGAYNFSEHLEFLSEDHKERYETLIKSFPENLRHIKGFDQVKIRDAFDNLLKAIPGEIY